MVGANTFRNPGLTAKLATTLDHLSDGRAVLGIGGAWFEREHEAFGIDFGDERRRAARPARRGGDADAPPARRRAVQPRGPVLHVPRRAVRAAPDPGAPADPRRRQRPKKTLRTVPEHADGWNTSGPSRRSGPGSTSSPSTAPTSAATSPTIEQTVSFPIDHPRRRRRTPRRPAGRCWPHNGVDDLGGVRPLLGSPAEVADAIRPYLELGFSTVIVRMPAPYDRETIDRMAEVSAAPRRRERRRPRRRHRWREAGPRSAARAPAGRPDVVVNTGDDIERHGLLVCPTTTPSCTCSTAVRQRARLGHRRRDLGRHGELERYGEEAWFRLGDRDLATHIARGARLRAGADADRGRARPPGAPSASPTTILPMTDEPVRTQVRTDEGWLEFQEYFVHRHQEPDVREVRFVGIEEPGRRPRSRRRSQAADGDRHRRHRTRSCRSGRSWPCPGMRGAARGGARAGRPGRRGERDRRRQGAQGAGRPDAAPRSGYEVERDGRGARCSRASSTSSCSTRVDAALEPRDRGARACGRS